MNAETDSLLGDESKIDKAINLPWFIAYKWVNSLFLGLSIGTIFIIYAPLSPSVYSAGGIGLAIGTLLVATQYGRILTHDWFFRISMMVEVVILVGILGVLQFDVSPALAMFIYIGYQVSFTFGAYLVRCETLLIPENTRLTQLDVAKQTGYLVGMGVSWATYEIMARFYGIEEKNVQVVLMHYGLLLTEVLVIVALALAFKKRA